MLASAPPVEARQISAALPTGIRSTLDAAHPGWQPAAVQPEVRSEILSRTPTWPINVIFGDFDGNGETDVALLIEAADTATAGGRAVRLYAFLAAGAVFTPFVLEPPAPHDARQFLHLVRERPGGDAIGVEYDAIGGHVWRWRDGQWRSTPW